MRQGRGGAVNYARHNPEAAVREVRDLLEAAKTAALCLGALRGSPIVIADLNRAVNRVEHEKEA